MSRSGALHITWEAVAGIIALLMFARSLVTRTWRGFRRVDGVGVALFGDVKANKPGIEQVLTQMQTVASSLEQQRAADEEWRSALMHRLVKVETSTAELNPNGGESIKDRVGRTITQVTDLRRDVDSLRQQVATLIPTQRPAGAGDQPDPSGT